MKKATLSVIFSAIAVLGFSVIFTGCTKPGDQYVTKGLQAMKVQNYDLAIQFFEKAVSEKCNYSDEILYSFMAKIYIDKGEVSKAIECYEKALANGNDYLTCVSLGMAYHVDGQDDKAIETYNKAIEFNPKKCEAYAAVGAIYLGQNKIKEAKEAFLNAIEITPKLAIAHANLALVYGMEGEKEKCLSELKAAEELKVENYGEFKIRCEELTK